MRDDTIYFHITNEPRLYDDFKEGNYVILYDIGWLEEENKEDQESLDNLIERWKEEYSENEDKDEDQDEDEDEDQDEEQDEDEDEDDKDKI